MSALDPKTSFPVSGRMGLWSRPLWVVAGGLALTVLMVSALQPVGHTLAETVAGKELGRSCENLGARFNAVVAELSRAERWVVNEPGLTDTEWDRWFENSVRPAFPEILELGFGPVVRSASLSEAPSREEETNTVREEDLKIPIRFLASAEGSDFPVLFRTGILSGNLIEAAPAGRDPGDVLITLRRTLATGVARVSALMTSPGREPGSNSPRLVCLYLPAIQISPEPVRATNLTGIFFAVLDLDRMVGNEVGAFAPGAYYRFQVQNDDSTWTTASENGAWPDPGEDSVSLKIVAQETRILYGRRFHCEFWSRPGVGVVEASGRVRTAAVLGMLFTGLFGGLVWKQGRIRRNENRVAAELTEAHSRLAAAIHERERLTRDLHDGTIQSIYAVGFDLQRVRNLITRNPEAARTELTRTMATLNNVVVELREFILQAEPGGGQVPQNLDSVLQALVDRVRRNTHAEILLELSSDAAQLVPPRQVVELLQIVREAVTNSLRHGYPRQVGIALTRDGGDWRLTIADDGSGFDAQRASDHNGHGLRNLQERAAELGGACEIVSAPGTGTAVRVVFPVLQGRLEPELREGNT